MKTKKQWGLVTLALIVGSFIGMTILVALDRITYAEERDKAAATAIEHTRGRISSLAGESLLKYVDAQVSKGYPAPVELQASEIRVILRDTTSYGPLTREAVLDETEKAINRLLVLNSSRQQYRELADDVMRGPLAPAVRLIKADSTLVSR